MWQEKDNKLSKKYKFKTFEEAIGFINKVAAVASEMDHHPEIINNYDTVDVSVTTHSEGGVVTDKDKEFAKKVENILREKESSDAKLQLYTDGGSRGNPGPSAIGYVIYNLEGDVVKKHKEFIGKSTNNQAEYQALLAGLQACVSFGKEVEVFMDSELIVNQLNGNYKVKNKELLPVYNEVLNTKNKFNSVVFSHIPREKNSVADKLVNEALDEN